VLGVLGKEQVLGHAAGWGSLTSLAKGWSPDMGAVPGEQPDSWGVTLLQEGLVTWESSRVGLTTAWVMELSAQGLCQVSPS